MEDLFTTKIGTPLAERLRANSLTEVFGQDHLLGKDGIITNQIQSGNIKSMILWGPPGCGKTTIAKLIAKYIDAEFVMLSAVFSGVNDLKKVFSDAANLRNIGRRTILFIDEIHRFNKSQQDSFLPYVENGTVTLIGATTENPSFELNSALLSRCQVLILKRLDIAALNKLINKAENELQQTLPLTEEARNNLVNISDGDGRYLLNLIETILDCYQGKIIDNNGLNHILQSRLPNYDKSGEVHYNLISALHKSLRGSDPDAALYWCARMMEGGEDPKYILRRLTRFAVEDVGIADPNALPYAINAWQAYERLGSPEGDLALASLVIYLGTAPKSNATETAWNKARAVAKETGSLPPPMHIINAPTKLMKQQGFGKGYIYDPDTKDSFSGQNYWPDNMNRETFYVPFERGFEREVKKRLEYWKNLRNKINSKK